MKASCKFKLPPFWGAVVVLVIWAVFLLPGCICDASAAVVINEVQSSNSSSLLDQDGEASDWIELYNSGSSAVNLAGWGLSDNSGKPYKWVFPARVIEPGEHLVVFASGKDRTNGLEVVELESLSEVEGLVVWLSAESAGYSHNDKVPQWQDISGMGNHATQSTANKQPLLVTNAVNGLPAVKFNRSNGQHLLLPVGSFNGMSTLRDVTVMAVCCWQGGVTSGIFGGFKAGYNNNTHFEIQAGGRLRFRVAGNDNGLAGGALSAGVWALAEGVSSSLDDEEFVKVYRDGVLKGYKVGDPGSGADIANYTHLYIADSDSGSRGFDGEMAEVVIFNRALEEWEREAVELYLARRYSLPFKGGARESELHTNFSLSSGGESVVLSMADGEVADLVEVPALPVDTTYGRKPDGSGDFTFFAEPTPWEASAAIDYSAPVWQPIFSVERGIYEEAFELVITSPDPEAVIYYTLDGSEPAVGSGQLYSAPISINGTSVVRAMAHKAGSLPHRAIATHSYMFLSDVIGQTTTPPGLPGEWGGYGASYCISAAVAAEPGYGERMVAALESIPMLSIVTEQERLFGASSGVYTTADKDNGLDQVVSAEWITNGVGCTQIDCFLRAQGGASRLFGNTPKKSLRLRFKSALGQGRLRVPVLSSGGTEVADFNGLVLRAEYNNSWVHWEGAQRLRSLYMRDQWVRDTQIAMSGTGSHGNHVHLFLNGQYWGVYNVAERPDAAFGGNYFGGERRDYDAVTHGGLRDGSDVAWRTMVSLAGSNLNERVNYEALQEYLDIDHFIDYMIINIYGGNLDWPNNNWNAIRRREEGAGYLFYCWDSERTLEGVQVDRSKVSGSLDNGVDSASFYNVLRQVAEFKLAFADRLHKHFFNGGALTPQQCIERFVERAEMVEPALYGEVARWGAYRNEIYDRGGPSPKYSMTDWSSECVRVTGSYFPVRSDIVLNQFRSIGLYPSVAAPEFSQHGGVVAEGSEVIFTNSPGVVYMTLDGSDPREAFSGAVAESAVVVSGPFVLPGSVVVKARALSGGVWSALSEAEFRVVEVEPVFLPESDGDWGVGGNWSGGIVPQGAGKRARVVSPAASRNINLREPLTIGGVVFEHGHDEARERVRDRSSGNTLTFDGGSGEALIEVGGGGSGFVEFEVDAGVWLASDLRVDVQHLGGSEEYGALRLRQGWSGTGGIYKSGAGVVALTGDNKLFTGPVVIEEGVVKVTRSAVPGQSSGVVVEAGGQLRLYSANEAGSESAVHEFGGTITLSGYGRGEEIEDGAGEGKLGALRYDPATKGNTAVVATPVAVVGSCGIHVDGARNRMVLAAGISGGELVVKSGGGELMLAGSVVVTSAVEVANGVLSFGNSVVLGEVGGSGRVRIDGGVVVEVERVGGVVVEGVLESGGAGSYVANGYLRAGAVAGELGGLRLYLGSGNELVYRGALVVPMGEGVSTVLGGVEAEVYRVESEGEHEFGGERWGLVSGAQVVLVPVQLDGGVEGRMVEVRLDGEPASYPVWRRATFSDGGEYESEVVSGPLAAPFGDGVPNLLRYAYGLGAGEIEGAWLPHLSQSHKGSWRYQVPYQPWRDDLIYIIEASSDVGEWGGAELLFDSRYDYPDGLEGGWLRFVEPGEYGRRFYRLKVRLR